MKTCFSEEKLMKQFGNPPLPKRTPSFLQPLLFLSSFFTKPLFVQILKIRTPPPNFRGEETDCQHKSWLQLTIFDVSCFTLTPCCVSYEVTSIQYIFQIKILSKDTPSFQRRDWLKNERQKRLKYDAVWAKPNMVNVNETDHDL